MGNTVSRVVDIGLRAVCVATGGLLGKSNQGYHLGPFRFSQDSLGLEFNFGVCAAGINVGTNDFGKNGIDASISYGIPKVATGSLRAGIDTDGCYVGLGGNLNIGPLQTGGSLVANKEGVRSYSAKVTGPLLTNIKYSDKKGVSGGIFGASANKAGEIEYGILEQEVAKTIGKKFEDEHKSYKEERQRERDKNAIKILREYEQKYLGKKFDRTLDEEFKLYQKRKQREKDEEDALKKADESEQYNLGKNIWRTFQDDYESYQERRQCERDKKAMKSLREYEQKYLGKKFDRTFEEEFKLYQERKQRQKDEEDALKKADDNEQFNYGRKIWRTFQDEYEAYQENRQREGDKEALRIINEYERNNRGKKADDYFSKGDPLRQMKTNKISNNNESYRTERPRERNMEALKMINEYERNNLGKKADDVLKKGGPSRDMTTKSISNARNVYTVSNQMKNKARNESRPMNIRKTYTSCLTSGAKYSPHCPLCNGPCQFEKISY